MNDESPILQIFNESGVDIPLQEKKLSQLLEYIEKQEHCRFSFVELVYVDEKEIIRINSEYLQREYITDIISFRYDEDQSNSQIEGTLYCCAPRIKEQAREFDESVSRELLRIFIHGLLHLIGFEDKASAEKKQMTALEDHYLAYSKSI
ncbi:MAG: rRNA maturation RNase YbeY [Balneolaceae bacterium]